MPSAAADEVYKMNQDLLAAWTADPEATMDDMRRIFEEHMANFEIAGDVEFEQVDAGGVPAIWAKAPNASEERAVVHFHSGGYVLGSADGYRSFGANLSRASGAPVLLVDYRLAPEHPAPAALEDAVSAYRWLLAQGVSPAKIVISGDSAGGGLALSLLQALRDQGDPQPAACVTVSPLADWTFVGESMTTNAQIDPLVPGPAMLEGMRTMVIGEDGDGADPRVSPLFGDWSGVAPLLVYAGSIECLHDDGKRCVEAAAAAGVDARFVSGEGMTHIWTIYADRLPEARTTLDEIGAFVEEQLMVEEAV